LIPIALGGTVAHTIVTFGFSDGSHVAFSVEARRETDEKYSPWGGMARQYELLHVIATERDVLGTRVYDRNNTVYLFPLNLTQEELETAFLALATDAEKTRTEPRWYHSLWRSCTTAVTDAINEASPGRIPMSWRLILTGKADRLAYDIGLLNTTLPFEELREAYRIDDIARENCSRTAPDVEFSVCVRSGRPS
jgi:hypothetical protein